MKTLTKGNWKELDPVGEVFLWLNTETGETGSLFPDRWLDEVLRPQLTENVPEDVVQLFEAARGAMLYGCFYYPLFALGKDQLHRVAEAAVTVKYETLRGPTRKDKRHQADFNSRIAWLKANSHMTPEDWDEWNWVRKARNEGSHLNSKRIYPPMPSVLALEETALRINRLFEHSENQT